MKALTLPQLDYRYILIRQYKEFGLNENELVILLLIDTLNREKPSLITGDQLKIKMTLDASQIEQGMVDLMTKGFLSYESVGGILVTSMEKTYRKIVESVQSEIVKSAEDESEQIAEDSFAKVLRELEEEMQRSLTPLEIQIVQSWFKDDVGETGILNAINECILKRGKVSVKQVDRLIVKNITHADRVEEGASIADEKTKRDIKKAMDIAAYDWVNNDDK